MSHAQRSETLLAGAFVFVTSALMACGSSGSSSFPGGGGGEGGGGGGGEGGGGGGAEGGLTRDSGTLMSPTGMDATLSPDAFFATDPPPMYCGVDGGSVPDVGGTLACPSDKNREGCPCPTLGASAACWPGLRVDRDIGVCKDGTTMCISTGEGLDQVWAACSGYVLPTPGATSGAAACQCFSAGQWQIDNLSPCFITYGAQTYAVSTYINASGESACPDTPSSTPPPAPQPGQPWSTDTLTVDCEGQFQLCYTLKAGSAKTPSPSDCVVASVCTSAFYTMANQPQTFPPLPSWTGTNPTCAASFANSGGYGEMSVLGKSELCEAIDNGMGAAEVFNRVQYCPSACDTDPTGAGCTDCMQGGMGGF